MQIKKQYLEVFYKTLKGTEDVLSLTESRTRDAFMKPLGELTDNYLKDRNKIYETFCDKNEDGTPNIADGNYHFNPLQKDEINQELLTLANEEVELKDEPKLKEILEKTQYKPKVGEIEHIDEILTKF